MEALPSLVVRGGESSQEKGERDAAGSSRPLAGQNTRGVFVTVLASGSDCGRASGRCGSAPGAAGQPIFRRSCC